MRICVLLAVCLTATLGQTTSSKGAAEFHVAQSGNDAWSGSQPETNAGKTDGPFATLERARDAIRALKVAKGLPNGGAIVWIRGGNYERSAPFVLTADDSGTKDAPITYKAYASEEVRLSGGKRLRGFEPVRDPEVLAQLDPQAKDPVRQFDLKQQGITDFGEVAGNSTRMELFFRDEPMTVARWPNEGFARIVDIVVKDGHQIHGHPGSKVGKFVYDGDRPQRWGKEKDLWLHGYWFWDWSEQRQQVEAIDLKQHVITLKPPVHGYGYRKGQWYYAFNALAELDAPGEWYLDREKGLLYFWPPATLDDGAVMVSLSPTLVTLKDASFVTLDHLTLDGSRGTAATITGGTGSGLTGCTILNCGGGAVNVSGGTNHSVVGCDIYQVGGDGISISGGDRGTLTPANHLAENNHIHHYARWHRVYNPGIMLQGVGNRAAHNLIETAPHMAIGFGGNDHVIEFNEIHSVCYESNDAGAIYAGRNWTTRGTVVRNNYMHDISGHEHRGCVGVYLDDMFCGTEISGNLFHRVTSAAFIGGGRDCTVSNNLFVDCSPSLHIDARALGWAGYHAQEWIKEGHETGLISGIAYKQHPYSERYPRLVNILEEEPAAPKGNLVTHNVSVGGKWDDIEAKAREYVTLADNLVAADPKFTTPERIGAGKHPRPVDFALQADSPAWSIGFEKLPLEKMGLYESPSRARWPVTHSVRP